jgi:hypothetical protein
VKKHYVETLKAKNRNRLNSKPWTLGLLEAMAAVDYIFRQKWETKNRLALIILDSNFEIALKEFIIHRSDLFPASQYRQNVISEIMEKRYKVIDLVAQKMNISEELINKCKHYYELRNKFIHEKATVSVVDSDIQIYKKVLEEILSLLFDLEF